jgi:hypothetical protein
LILLALGDEGSHDRVIHKTQNRDCQAQLLNIFALNTNNSRVIHKKQSCTSGKAFDSRGLPIGKVHNKLLSQ